MKINQLIILTFIILLGCKTSNQTIKNNKNIETLGPKNGTLLIFGGGYSEILYSEFMDLIGGCNAPIVVIPTALSSNSMSEEFLLNFKNHFINKGFTNVTVMHTKDTNEANSEDFILPLKNAAGVWFSGGRQWLFADSYLNTKTHKAFIDLLNRGGVIAGSSAGATIQGSYLARGDTKGSSIMVGDHEIGFGFISNVAIDQHVFARNRQFDMYEILDRRPEILGIGLDEKTGIIVQGNRFRVVGESYVAIYDGTRWSEERDTLYQLPEKSKEFYLLRADDEYDLKKRKVITFKDRQIINLSAQQQKQYTGVYKLKGDTLIFEILTENDTIKVIEHWNDSKYPIFPESVSKFYPENSKQFLKFDININGDIDSFSIPIAHEIWEKITG